MACRSAKSRASRASTAIASINGKRSIAPQKLNAEPAARARAAAPRITLLPVTIAATQGAPQVACSTVQSANKHYRKRGHVIKVRIIREMVSKRNPVEDKRAPTHPALLH